MADSSLSTPRLALFAALPQEYRRLLRRIPNRKRTARAPYPRFALRLPGFTATLVETGMGCRNLDELFDFASASGPIDAVLSFGFCGALVEPMALGRVVFGAGFSEPHDDHASNDAVGAVAHYPEALRRFLSAAKVQPAQVVSVRRLQDKARVPFDFRSGAAVVDMESTAWARFCASRNLPFLCLRSVSDLRHQAIAYGLEPLTDARGRVRSGKALLALLRHPDWIPHFCASWKRANVASSTLTDALWSLLSLPPPELRTLLHQLKPSI